MALGLASGFLEPLESTSIHMVMSGTYKLLEHFPNKRFAQENINSYNNELIQEIERIRDFIILHYLTGRNDTPHLAILSDNATARAALLERMELYRRCGRIRYKAGELFTDLSWFYIFEGIGITPESYDPLIDVVKAEQLQEILKSIAQAHAAAAEGVPSHDSYFAAATQAR